MTGAGLSRWTMSYFTIAMVFLIAAQAMMVSGYGFPAAATEAPETFVLVHMVTIGWLSLLMWGALFQFVPVLVAKPLQSAGLVLPALLAMIAGLAFCSPASCNWRAQSIRGFLSLPAGVLLPSGFALATWVIAPHFGMRGLSACRHVSSPAGWPARSRPQASGRYSRAAFSEFAASAELWTSGHKSCPSTPLPASVGGSVYRNRRELSALAHVHAGSGNGKATQPRRMVVRKPRPPLAGLNRASHTCCAEPVTGIV